MIPVEIIVPVIEVNQAQAGFDEFVVEMDLDASFHWKDGNHLRFGVDKVDVRP